MLANNNARSALIAIGVTEPKLDVFGMQILQLQGKGSALPKDKVVPGHKATPPMPQLQPHPVLPCEPEVSGMHGPSSYWISQLFNEACNLICM